MSDVEVLPTDQAVLVEVTARAVHTGDVVDVDQLRRVIHGLSPAAAARFDDELRTLALRYPEARERLCQSCGEIADQLLQIETGQGELWGQQ